MNVFSSVSRSSEITVVEYNLNPKHTLTCPFVRILFNSAEDFFKLKEETSQLLIYNPNVVYSRQSNMLLMPQQTHLLLVMESGTV